ncbi:hypothetical protein EDD29_4623 [Actinocorallia herbida]|uniref:Thioesterase domain-containing protein n=1 Tax=Actinocorallia herbida TaxID=58109 RepID=A0A3N1D0I7_9ACTN|nr:hypothetical protein [Actinocorallia herbida]ROO87034.1 hypothetical protein EDD29_4623 [Actinocorallia herbida]
MAQPVAFNVLRGSSTADLILASDFAAATGRTVGSFSDLIPKVPTSEAVWETRPPAPGDRSADDHLDRWAAEARASGMTVRCVLGYCVGSVFGAGLVERISAWQEPPALIVFDPEAPHPALLHRHYLDAIGALTGFLTADQATAARTDGDAALAERTAMPELAKVLSDLVVAHGEPALTRIGLAADRSAELLGGFRAFLSYLVSAAELDPGRGWAAATAITSASEHNGLNTLPAGRREGVVAREIRFDLPHAELLRAPEVAAAVHDLLIEGAR